MSSSDLQSLREEVEALSIQKAKVERQKSRLDERLKSTQAQLDEVDDARSSLERDVKRVSRDYNRVKTLLDEENETRKQLEVRLFKADASISHLRSQLERSSTDAAIASLPDNEKKRLSSDIERLEHRVLSEVAERRVVEQQRASLERKLADVQQRILAEDKARTEMSQALETKAKQLSDVLVKLEEVEKRNWQLELRTNADADGWKNRMEDELRGASDRNVEASARHRERLEATQRELEREEKRVDQLTKTVRTLTRENRVLQSERKEALEAATQSASSLSKAERDARVSRDHFLSEANDLRAAKTLLEHSKAALESDVERLTRLLDTARDTISSLKTQRQRLQSKVESLTLELAREREERSTLETRLRETEWELAGTRQKARVADELSHADADAARLRTELEAARNRNAKLADDWKRKLERKTSELSIQLEAKNRALDDSKVHSNTLGIHLRATERQLADTKRTLRHAESEMRNLRGELAHSKALLNDNIDAREKLQASDYDLSAKKAAIDEYQVELAATRARVKALESKAQADREAASADRALRLRVETERDLLERDLRATQVELEDALIQAASAKAAASMAASGGGASSSSGTALGGGDVAFLSKERDRLLALEKKLKAKLRDAVNGLAHAQDEISDHTSTITKLSSQQRVLKEQLSTASATASQEAKDARLAESKVSTLSQRLAMVESDLSTSKNSEQSLQRRLEQMEEDLATTRSNADSRIKAATLDKQRALDDNEFLDRKNAEYRISIKGYETKISRLEEKLKTIELSSDRGLDEEKSLSSELGRVESLLDSKQRENRELSSKLKNAEKKMRHLRDSRAEVIAERDDLAVDVKSFKRQLIETRQQLEKEAGLAREAKDAQARLASDSAIGRELSREVAELDEKRRKLSDEVMDLSRRLTDAEDERDRSVKKFKAAKFDLEEALATQDSLRDRSEELVRTRDRLASKLKDVERELASARLVVASADQSKRDATRSAKESARYADELERTNERLMKEFRDKERTLTDTMRDLESENDSLKDRLSDKEGDFKRLTQRAVDLADELDVTSKKLTELRANSSAVSDDLKGELLDLTADLKDEKARRNQLEEELLRTTNEREKAAKKLKKAVREVERLRTESDVAAEHAMEQSALMKKALRAAEEDKLRAIQEAGEASSNDRLLEREIAKLRKRLEAAEGAAAEQAERNKLLSVELRKALDRLDMAQEDKDELKLSLRRAEAKTRGASGSNVTLLGEQMDRTNKLSKELAVSKVERANLASELKQLKLKYENQVLLGEDKLKAAEEDIRVQVEQEMEAARAEAERAEAERIAALPPPVRERQRLLVLRGATRVQARLTSCSAGALDRSSVFLLDLGPKMYLWNGLRASNVKRTKGLNVANRIVKARGGRVELVIAEDGSPSVPEAFWDALGGKPESIPAAQPEDDAQLEAAWARTTTLYRINPGYKLFRIPGPLTRTKLQTRFGYILDAGDEVYVWLGREVMPDTIRGILKKAKLLFQNKQRAPWATLKKQSEGKEDILFKEKFDVWKGKDVSAIKKGGAAGASAGGAMGGSKRLGRIAKKDTEDAVLSEYSKTYSYAQLIAGNYSATVDTKQLEAYLDDAEFATVFGMTKDQFAGKSKWKQNELKKSKNLF